MTICVFSDTHGDSSGMERTVEYVKPEVVIHLGDFLKDASDIEHIHPGIQVVGVLGNCDSNRSGTYEKMLTLGGKKLLLIHGSSFGFSRRTAISAPTREIIQYAKTRAADILLFGHSHAPVLAFDNGLYIMNPGSASMDKQESKAPTFGIIELHEGGIACKILSIEAL